MIGAYADRYYDENGRRRETPLLRRPKPVTKGGRKSVAPYLQRNRRESRSERLELLPRSMGDPGPAVRRRVPTAKEIQKRAAEGYVPLPGSHG